VAVESDADRLSFLTDWNDDEPSPFLWGVAEITIIGHAGTAMLEAESGFGVQNSRATIQCRESDIPVGGAVGDAVTFRGAAHTVKSIQPDGTGMAIVTLEEV